MNRYLALLFFLVVAPSRAEIEQQFAAIGDLELESGQVLRDVRVGYVAAGELNADKSNVILFPTWFTGTARNLLDFEVIGPGKLADTLPRSVWYIFRHSGSLPPRCFLFVCSEI